MQLKALKCFGGLWLKKNVEDAHVLMQVIRILCMVIGRNECRN